jgi:hypothetical protein
MVFFGMLYTPNNIMTNTSHTLRPYLASRLPETQGMAWYHTMLWPGTIPYHAMAWYHTQPRATRSIPGMHVQVHMHVHVMACGETKHGMVCVGSQAMAMHALPQQCTAWGRRAHGPCSSLLTGHACRPLLAQQACSWGSTWQHACPGPAAACSWGSTSLGSTSLHSRHRFARD